MRTDERIQALLLDAALRDDPALPDDLALVPADERWSDDVVYRQLLAGRPTLMVGADLELMLIPRRRSLIDRLRGGVRVRVSQRSPGMTARVATSTRLGRHPVSEMRRLAGA